jgi:hypothetical protein
LLFVALAVYTFFVPFSAVTVYSTPAATKKFCATPEAGLTVAQADTVMTGVMLASGVVLGYTRVMLVPLICHASPPTVKATASQAALLASSFFFLHAPNPTATDRQRAKNNLIFICFDFNNGTKVHKKWL